VPEVKLVEGVDFYRDASGWAVWTRKFLLDRGFCCSGGCRHCPYDDAGRVVPEPWEKVGIIDVEST